MLAFTRALWSEAAPRSCCGFCPFAESCGSWQELLDRWRSDPADLLEALQIEHGALALNPRMTLYASGQRLLGKVAAHAAADTAAGHPGQLDTALAAYDDWLATAAWAVYAVERIKHDLVRTHRRVTIRHTGNRASAAICLAQAATAAGLPLTTGDDGIVRLIQRERAATYPQIESFLVAAPQQAIAKARPSFAAAWSHATQQLSLL